MKILFRSMTMLAITAMFMMSACGDDDGEEDDSDPIVGVYSLNSVVLNNDVNYNDTDFPAGTDITTIVEQSLYVESPCDNPENTVVDLRETGSEVYYACKGESTDPVLFGTWDLSSDEETLTMYLTIADNPFPLSLTDLVITESGVTGTVTNYPLVEPDFSIVLTSVDIDFMRTTL